MIKYPFNCVEKLNIKIFCTLLCWDLSFYWRSSLISTMRYIQRSGDNCQQLVLKLELEMELEPGVICYSCLQSPAPSLNGSCHSGNEDLMITHHHHYTTYLMGKQNIANIAKIQITNFWVPLISTLRMFCVEMCRSVMFQLQIGPFLIYASDLESWKLNDKTYRLGLQLLNKYLAGNLKKIFTFT